MNKNIKKPNDPKVIPKSKYFNVRVRDSARVRIIKEGMNHLFDIRNHEMEDAFYHEAVQYTEKIIGETRRFHFTEDEDNEIRNMIFGGIRAIEQTEPGDVEKEQEGAGISEEEIIDDEEERLEVGQELDDSETLDSEEVLALQERIQQEDQEEYDRIRAELDEEEANKDN